MSHPGLEINVAMGTGGLWQRLAHVLVGEGGLLVVPLTKGLNPQPFWGESIKERLKTEEAGGRRSLRFIPSCIYRDKRWLRVGEGNLPPGRALGMPDLPHQPICQLKVTGAGNAIQSFSDG